MKYEMVKIMYRSPAPKVAISFVRPSLPNEPTQAISSLTYEEVDLSSITGRCHISTAQHSLAKRMSFYQALRRFLGDIPTEAFGSVRGFMATGYVVGIAIVDGVSSMEMFSKNNRSEMTPTEIETLLKANGPGEWISESISKPNWKRWRRVDGTLVGLYDAKRHFLYISSKSFYDAQGAKLEKQSHTE